MTILKNYCDEILYEGTRLYWSPLDCHLDGSSAMMKIDAKHQRKDGSVLVQVVDPTQITSVTTYEQDDGTTKTIVVAYFSGFVVRAGEKSTVHRWLRCERIVGFPKNHTKFEK